MEFSWEFLVAKSSTTEKANRDPAAPPGLVYVNVKVRVAAWPDWLTLT